jgi:hypothetical protein
MTGLSTSASSWALTMSEPVLIDNDIVLKACCYSIVDEMLACLGGHQRPVVVLGAARFIVGSRIRRACDIANPLSAAQALEQLLVQVDELEPDDREIALAAAFEAETQALGLDLGSGESLLLAALLCRVVVLLLTGDKRAIYAIERLMQATDGVGARGRIACLEQLAMGLLGSCDCVRLRDHICREPAVDRALSICFACGSAALSPTAVIEGLASYVRALRRDAPTVLVRTDDLSAVISQENGVGL